MQDSAHLSHRVGFICIALECCLTAECPVNAARHAAVASVDCSHRVYAVVQAFHWNSTSPSAQSDPGCSEGGQLCPVCRAPMITAEVGSLNPAGGHAADHIPDMPCCRSCSHQLPSVLEPARSNYIMDIANGGPPAQHELPAVMRMRIKALRTGMLLDP